MHAINPDGLPMCVLECVVKLPSFLGHGISFHGHSSFGSLLSSLFLPFMWSHSSLPSQSPLLSCYGSTRQVTVLFFLLMLARMMSSGCLLCCVSFTLNYHTEAEEFHVGHVVWESAATVSSFPGSHTNSSGLGFNILSTQLVLFQTPHAF
jgi:hypothetical protein